MRLLSFLMILFFSVSCSDNFLNLSLEYQDYTAQQVRDIEFVRGLVDTCDSKKCFYDKLNPELDKFCAEALDSSSPTPYLLRGYVSKAECDDRYFYIFAKLFGSHLETKKVSVNKNDEYIQALKKYELALAKFTAEDYKFQNAKDTYESSEDDTSDKDIWKNAQKAYKEAWEAYKRAWDSYMTAKIAHLTYLESQSNLTRETAP